MPQISVVIPVYRAEACIEELYGRLKAALEAITADFEIIMVEDCGGDRSWEKIEGLSALDPRVKGIQLSRNFGQHAATLCGLEHASGQWVVTMDDDLEQDPGDIARLYEKAAIEGRDLVYGVYPVRTHSFWRNLTSAIARRLFRLAIPGLNIDYTSFRCIRGRIARSLSGFDSPFPFVDGYLSWVTNNYSTVPVRHGKNLSGGSAYTIRKLLIHAVNMFVTFSALPLKAATWLGFAVFVVGLVWLSAIVLMKFMGDITVSGYASLMAGIILFGGLQMLILGIIGEYLGVVNFKTSRKPLFIVSRKSGPETDAGRTAAHERPK